MKGVHPVVDQQFGNAVPLLDLAKISAEFPGAITTQSVFLQSFASGVIAMPGELHAGLCHVFLVKNKKLSKPKKDNKNVKM